MRQQAAAPTGQRQYRLPSLGPLEIGNGGRLRRSLWLPGRHRRAGCLLAYKPTQVLQTEVGLPNAAGAGDCIMRIVF